MGGGQGTGAGDMPALASDEIRGCSQVLATQSTLIIGSLLSCELAYSLKFLRNPHASMRVTGVTQGHVRNGGKSEVPMCTLPPEADTVPPCVAFMLSTSVLGADPVPYAGDSAVLNGSWEQHASAV